MAGPVTLEPVNFLRPVDRSDELRSVAAVRFLELPPRTCVMIDGQGPPEPAVFRDRMPGLYTAAWSLRFALKRRGVVTRVGPLEGLWWTVDGTTDLDAIFGGDQAAGRAAWRWTLFIALPDEDAQPGAAGGVSPSGKKYKHWAKVGGWKYLEKPYNLKIKGMDERVASAVKEDLGL